MQSPQNVYFYLLLDGDLSTHEHVHKFENLPIDLQHISHHAPWSEAYIDIGHFHMNLADPAGGNNKPVAIVQPGNWLTEHKHTS